MYLKDILYVCVSIYIYVYVCAYLLGILQAHLASLRSSKRSPDRAPQGRAFCNTVADETFYHPSLQSLPDLSDEADKIREGTLVL